MGTTSFVTTAITNMLAEVIRTNCQGEKNSKAYATNIIQVTFKDLQKLVQSQSSPEQTQLIAKTKR